MKWYSTKLLTLGLSICSFYLSTAEGSAHRTIFRSATQRVIDIYKRNHSFTKESIRTWDLLLVEEKDTETPIHVGMAFRNGTNQLMVLEAVPILGVKSTDFKTFKERCRYNNIYALRPQENFLKILEKSDQEGFWRYFQKKLVNLPYNYSMQESYNVGGIKYYYCSQLLRDMYNYILQMEDELIDIMPLKEMNFEEAFAKEIVTNNGFKIPYGQPGVSPADFSKYNFCYLGSLSLQYTRDDDDDETAVEIEWAS